MEGGRWIDGVVRGVLEEEKREEREGRHRREKKRGVVSRGRERFFTVYDIMIQYNTTR